MLIYFVILQTRAGRIAIGATVRSTRYRDVQGLVTAIYCNGYHYAIEVNNRHSDDAGQYELLRAKPCIFHTRLNSTTRLIARFSR